MRAKGLWAFGLTAAAALWSAAMIGYGAWGPAYTTVTESDSSENGLTTSITSSTLVDENGLGVLALLAVPLALALVTWFALHRRCARGSGWSSGLAWCAVALLALLALLGSASVGGLFLPTVALLAVAAALTPRADA